jgi:hypothetical protein
MGELVNTGEDEAGAGFPLSTLATAEDEGEDEDDATGEDVDGFFCREDLDGPAWGKTGSPRASSSGSRNWSRAKKEGSRGVQGFAPGFTLGTGMCFFATVVMSAMIINSNLLRGNCIEVDDDGLGEGTQVTVLTRVLALRIALVIRAFGFALPLVLLLPWHL